MTNFKKLALRTLAVSAIAAIAMSNANAGVFFFRTAVVAPVVVTPVIAAPVVVAPVAVAPVVVAPVVYVPTCRFITVPVMNAFTGFTYLVTRRVCN
jgi:hypothetical protein